MKTLADLRSWAAAAPAGTLLRAEGLTELLAQIEEGAEPGVGPAQVDATPWRVMLWTAPAETRIGRAELLEAVGRPPSWLYRATSVTKTVREGREARQVPKAAGERIPHRKLDGELVFVVGEVRAWLREREEIIEAGPLDQIGLRAVAGRR